jgi:hypothetical protein
MCIGIAILAIAIVIWKADLSGFGLWMMLGVKGTLVATSVFAFALSPLMTGRGNRPFLVGFLRAGFITELAYWVCCWVAPWLVLDYAQNPIDQAVIVGLYFDAIPRLEEALLRGSPDARLLFDMTCSPLIVAINSLPVLSVAMMGGWASRKFARRSPQPRPVTT